MEPESKAQAAPRPAPPPLEIGMSASELIDRGFAGGTAAALRTAAEQLLAILTTPETTVALLLDDDSLAGGTARAAALPLMAGGYVDWIVTRGEILYADALHALGCRPYPPPPEVRANAEQALREILALPDFQATRGSAWFHRALGEQLRAREKALGIAHASLLSSASEYGVPVHNAEPGAGRLAACIAELALHGNRLGLDASNDINQAAAILNRARTHERACAVLAFGAGPALRLMRVIPGHLAALLGLAQPHRYDKVLQLAPPSALAAASGDTEQTAACFSAAVDASIALPLLTSYALDRAAPRPPKRLAPAGADLLDQLRQDCLQATLRRATQFDRG